MVQHTLGKDGSRVTERVLEEVLVRVGDGKLQQSIILLFHFIVGALSRRNGILSIDQQRLDDVLGGCQQPLGDEANLLRRIIVTEGNYPLKQHVVGEGPIAALILYLVISSTLVWTFLRVLLDVFVDPNILIVLVESVHTVEEPANLSRLDGSDDHGFFDLDFVVSHQDHRDLLLALIQSYA